MSIILSERNTPIKHLNSTSDKSLLNKPKNLMKLNEIKNKSSIKNNNSVFFNNNKIYFSKNLSPISTRIKPALSPSINHNNSNKKINSQQKSKILKVINSNSLKDIYKNKNFLSPKLKKYLGSERTQTELTQNINIFNDIQNNNKKLFNNIFRRQDNKNNDNRNNYKYKIKQINNIKNINHANIQIYSTKMNTETEEEKNTINSTFYNENISSFFNNDNNSNSNIIDKNMIRKRFNNKKGLNKNYSPQKYALTPKKEILLKYNEYINVENKNIHTKIKYRNNNQLPNLTNPEEPIIINNNKKEKKLKKEISNNLPKLPSISILTSKLNINNKDDNLNINDKFYNYKSSTFRFIGNLLLENNYNKETRKKINKRYQLDITDINNTSDDKENIINTSIIKDDNQKLNSEGNNRINNNREELDSINEIKYFLKDFNEDNNRILILFLKLLQIHMDIELLLDINSSNNNNFRRRYKTINNDKIYKLNSLINNYFNTLSYLQKYTIQIQDNNGNSDSKNNRNIQDEVNSSNSFLYQKYNIFCFHLINNIFHKCIKLQICFYAAFLISLSQLSYDDIDSMIRTNFEKIIKEISNPLYKIFKIFMMNEIKDKYSKIFSNNIKPNFFDKFTNLFKEEKKPHSLKKSEILRIISNNIIKCTDSLKSYSNINLKNSIIMPFRDAFNQMLFKLERKTLNKFIDIFLNMILFGELEINKQKAQKNLENPYKNVSKSKYNIKKISYPGSSLFNNINEIPPYLPEMDEKYKYTLVLDMDETLVHFFFTNMKGMFFVRPYCFEFLNELNKYYEIVTFTAGIKDYADNILNLLDINNDIIKFRLYRQHVTIIGFNSYKNLKLLGRDLKKIIIIDNLKENFMMQPDNGLFIKTWTSDVNDTQFIDLLNILKNIAINNVNDVRPIIQRINEKIAYNGDLINPYSKINIKKIIDDEKK